MTGNIDFEKAQREETRWRILRVLDVGRPYPVGEGLILRTLADVQLPITSQGLRRELDYLEHRSLVKVNSKDSGNWAAELTATGIDFVEYTIDARPGIARPARG